MTRLRISTEETKTEHTPGPWEYGPAHNYHGFYIAPKGRLPTLAAVERASAHIVAFNFPGATEANARLIAAAPELLDALEFQTLWVESALQCKEWHWDSYQREAAEESCKVARSIIKKARGQ